MPSNSLQVAREIEEKIDILESLLERANAILAKYEID